MTSVDDVRAKAVKAANKAYREENKFGYEMDAAIDAYEAALWQPIETLPDSGRALFLSNWGVWYSNWKKPFVTFRLNGATHWRPLPAPPEAE